MSSSAISIVVGSILIGFIWWLALRRLAALRRAPKTEGTIVEMVPVQSISDSGGTSYVPRIQFRAHDGTEHVVTRVYSGSRTFRVGQTVRIAYDPKTYSVDILKPGQTFSLVASASALTLAIGAIIFF